MNLSELNRADASLVQHGLRATGFYAGTTNGIPGPKTASAYDAYLASLDGATKPKTDDVARLRAAIVSFAIGEVGVREEGGNNKGARIDWYEEATYLDPSGDYAWCASFCCRAVWEALKSTGISPQWARPRTPGAYAFRDQWAKANDGRGIKTYRNPRIVLAGDLLVYNFSHIGIAVEDSQNQSVAVVEGNTSGDGGRDGDGVYPKWRNLSTVAAALRIEGV